MSLYKIGEALVVSAENLRPISTVLPEHFDIVDRFTKIAEGLKTIAPKAKDFLYFSAVMMHAAEAALLTDSGEFIKGANGEPVTASWEKKGDSWKWVCSNSDIKPYANSNRDIFPEEELVKAHKEWIGKPLCLDHKSNSVDMIRGVIVDTYYDWPRKRVVALCALDKVTYPDLAHKVSSKCCSSVSMGTAVGRAICTDCGSVARIEPEFCEHMRNKSCYGEINVDLRPIELSIVVNGADPKARIRHIVASAAESLASYVSDKEREVSKLAESKMVTPDSISEIKNTLSDMVKKLEELENTAKGVEEDEKIEENEKPDEYGDLSGDKEASNNDINVKLASISQHLSRLQKDVDKLANIEETNMTMKSEAYHQGGGGVNDPSVLPYPKEDYATNRDKNDKQMVGQGVNGTGPVDGMHPGYSSFGESEEARKVRLQRMAAERSARRKQAVEKAQGKVAYHQGGGGVNDPSSLPYPKEDYATNRDKQDKQMVGAKPFPDVGPSDGLYPGDKETKEKLSRAKLTAKFIKSAHPNGTDNPGQCRWQVYADKKLILTATVDELTNGKADVLYDAVANKEFGKKILGMLRTDSFDKVKGILKGAQAPAPPEMPAEPVGDVPPAGAEMAPEVPEDAGGSGDPQEHVTELLDQAENVIADLRQAVEALMEKPTEGLDEFNELAETLPEEGGMPGAEPAPVTAGLVTFQKKVGSAITVGMKKAAKELSEHVEELRMAKHIYDNRSKVSADKLSYVNKLSADACADTKQTLADCYKLMEAFVKYANGTKAMMKRAQTSDFNLPEEPSEAPLSLDEDFAERRRKMFGKDVEFAPEHIIGKPSKQQPTGSAYSKPKADFSMPDVPNLSEKSMSDLDIGGTGGGVAKSKPKATSTNPFATTPAPTNRPAVEDAGGPEDIYEDLGSADVDVNESMTEQQAKDFTEAVKGVGGVVGSRGKAEITVESEAIAPNLSTKEGRAAYREKLAQKGLKFSPVLNEAHKGGFTTQLDTKPQKDLAKVETLEETHKAMMDVATAPPRIRQAAEEIQRLVIAGRIDPKNDFDALVANGLDADAVKYWKQYFAQGDSDCSQFATELVKEHHAKKAAVEQKAFEVKIARAYELANDMVSRGMISGERSAISEQVKEIMSFDDNGFESMKRFVDRQSLAKRASIPQVGLLDANNVTIPAPPAVGGNNLAAELESLWSGSGSRRASF
jgi:uncharacterized protein (DUF779 family)